MHCASYDRARFLKDFAAGVTVGIVALPLAMAFGIASGVKPEQGLITAIVAGFLIALLGGSNVQIGGPAGAFIVIVYGILQRYGLTNLLIATALAGVVLFLLGLFKLGALVRFVPVSIIIGFTNGIAVLIAFSQLRDLLGPAHRQAAGRLLRADRGAVAASRHLQPVRARDRADVLRRPVRVAAAVEDRRVPGTHLRGPHDPRRRRASRGRWSRWCR